MATSIEVPRRLPLLLVADNVLLPGSSMRIPVRSLRKLVSLKDARCFHVLSVKPTLSVSLCDCVSVCECDTDSDTVLSPSQTLRQSVTQSLSQWHSHSDSDRHGD